MNAQKNKQGFTLIELLVALTAGAILAATVVLLMLMPYKTLQTNRDFAQMRRDLAYTMRLLRQDVRITAWADMDDENVNSNVRNGYLNLDWDSDNVVVRRETVRYEQDGDQLIRYVGDEKGVVLISGGLNSFLPEVANNETNDLQGLIIKVDMSNDEGDLSLSHSTFIHTRN